MVYGCFIRGEAMISTWSESEARAFFSEVFCGEHHIPNRGKLKPCGKGWSVGGVYSPATWDGNLLTRLVFLAHDHCVRVDISPSQPGRLRIDAWKRAPIGAADSPIMMGHPTLEQAVALHRGKPLREIVSEAEGKP